MTIAAYIARQIMLLRDLVARAGASTVWRHSEWRLLGLTVTFGAVCALYINVAFAPPGFWFFMPFCLLFSALVFWRGLQRHYGVQLALMVMFACLVASWRIMDVVAPKLDAEHYVALTGIVEEYSIRPERAPRLTLQPTAMDDRTAGLPRRVRLIVRTKTPESLPRGATVSLNAILAPPSGPVVPGGYDFARAGFFKGVGAEGYAASPIRLHEGSSADIGWRQRLNMVRAAIAEKLVAILPGQAGAVAVALTVGDRHYIDKETAADIRDAGLAHLLAISGLHMGLITAAAFFVIEYLFAAIPAVALRVRPKKIAACVAWGIALAYLLLSGMGIATVRAFIMISVALLAVLADRRVLSLRSIALAALAILIVWPEAVLSVSFQMSFAATAALIAVYEVLAARGWTARRDAGPLIRFLRFAAFMAFTSLIAQVAIAPFALYHFQTLSVVGILANVVVVPMMSAAIMPLALLTLILMPLGLHAVPAHLLGFGLEQVMYLADYFAHFPYAVHRAGAPSDLYLMVASLCFCALLIVRHMASAFVLLALYVFLLVMPFGRTADVLLDREGRVIARADAASGRLQIIGGRRDSYRDESWRRYWGLDLEHEAGLLHRHCDASACRTDLGGGRYVTVLKSMSALRQACAAGDIVVGQRRWYGYCQGSAVYIFAESFNYLGTVAIYYPDNTELSQAYFEWSKPRGQRPWH